MTRAILNGVAAKYAGDTTENNGDSKYQHSAFCITKPPAYQVGGFCVQPNGNAIAKHPCTTACERLCDKARSGSEGFAGQRRAFEQNPVEKYLKANAYLFGCRIKEVLALSMEGNRGLTLCERHLER